MRRDPVPPDGEENPLDAALGELDDLADLERRFARLDARLDAVHRHEDTFEPRADEDDPFADVANALREHRSGPSSAHGRDRAGGADDQLELSLGAGEDEDDDGDELSDVERDPVDEEIEARCHDALDALEEGDLERARELALEAVRLDDEHPFPTFVLGLVAEQEGDLDAARDLAELSLRTAGTNADAIGLRAHIHVRQHELAEAEQLLRFGIAHNPDDPTLHEGLARVALARGEHREALRAANAALRLEPGNPGALAVRTAALDVSGDRGALLAALRQGVQLHPEDPYGMVELAAIEMEHGNLERARVLLMRAQRLAPRDPEISDVRRLVEHVHERPLLRPVPSLLRWLRDFPGGLAGFLVGYVIAALPLHALATAMPQYRVAAVAVIVAWGALALYAWVAPAALTHRLNQRAARGGAERLTRELDDPLAAPPALERLIDVCTMLVIAHDHRRAADLVQRAAQRSRSAVGTHEGSLPADAAPALERVAALLRRPSMRVARLLCAVPAAGRLLVACALVAAVAAPAIASWTRLPVPAWHAIALACAMAAWMLSRVRHRTVRRVDAAFASVHAAAAAAVARESTPAA